MNVVFHAAHPYRPTVSPVVYCDYGGGSLLRDLRRVVSEGAFGASDAALALAVRWAVEYGQHNVALFNLDTPGLLDPADFAACYPIHLAYAHRKVKDDPQWVVVDLAEYRVVGKHGVWELDEQHHA